MARFWEFQQLSDEWRGTSCFDEVPRITTTSGSSKKPSRGRLFIGGLAALYKEPNPLKENEITHVLSVLDFEIGDAKKEFGGEVKHLWIRLDDSPDENLLKHFKTTNSFINQALDGGGNVFVHCAMGVSRSATVVCAYLMWKFGKDRDAALEWLREGREKCFPNFGFWEQLGVYEDVLNCKTKREREEVVKRWSRGKYPPTKL